MRTCAACGLTFDTTRAQAAIERGTSPARTSITITIPGELTRPGIAWMVVSVVLFIAGVVGVASYRTTDHDAYGGAMVLLCFAIVVFLLCLTQLLSVRVVVTATELIVKRRWSTAHVRREDLSFLIQGGREEGEWFGSYDIWLCVDDDKRAAVSTRGDSEEAREQIARIRRAMDEVR
jgi:hypothetical protein